MKGLAGEGRGKGCWLEKGGTGIKLVNELTAYMAYCCAVRYNKEGTVAGKVLAVNCYHEH